MAKKNVPYEEKKFLMEFLNLWRRYDRPPIHLYTDNLVSNDRGSGSINGLQHQFIAEALDIADELGVNVQLECLGISGVCGDTPRSVMEADGDEDEPDRVTDYGDEDDDGDDATDYGEEDEANADEGATDGTDDTEGDDGAETDPEADNADGEEEDEPTDYGEEDTGDDNPEGDDGGEVGGDTTGEEDTATDYGDAGGETDATDSTTDDGAENTSSDEQSNSSNTNILVKNFSLMRDFEKLYALITDNANTLNSTLKADPGQNRVLVQVSRNLNNIKDFILTFIQFHFKSDNYQYNLYYYEVVVQLLKLNLTMVEKALTLGHSKKDNKKEVNKKWLVH